ncbi:hypothetical protein OKW29_000139 [Paraburkholderia sp. CI3]
MLFPPCSPRLARRSCPCDRIKIRTYEGVRQIQGHPGRRRPQAQAVACSGTTLTDEAPDPPPGRSVARPWVGRSSVALALEAQQQPVGRGEGRSGAFDHPRALRRFRTDAAFGKWPVCSIARANRRLWTSVGKGRRRRRLSFHGWTSFGQSRMQKRIPYLNAAVPADRVLQRHFIVTDRLGHFAPSCVLTEISLVGAMLVVLDRDLMFQRVRPAVTGVSPL